MSPHPSHCSQVPPPTLSPLTLPKDERPWCTTGSSPVSTSQLSALWRGYSVRTDPCPCAPAQLSLSPLHKGSYQGVLQLWVRVM